MLDNSKQVKQKIISRGASKRSRLTASLLCLFLGGIGIHKLYIGKYRSAVIIFLTGIIAWIACIIGIVTSATDITITSIVFWALAGILWFTIIVWVLVDLIRILTGSMKDIKGKHIMIWRTQV